MTWNLYEKLINYLWRSKSQPTQDLKEIPLLQPISRDKSLPLSFGQERFWFIQELDPTIKYYNILTNFFIEGEIDQLAIEKTLQDLLSRHEILRSKIKIENGKPSILILDVNETKVPLSSWDISRLSASAAQMEFSLIVEKALNKPFDLQNEIWLRVGLFKLAEKSYVLSWVMHHIATDYKSLLILEHDFWEIYRYHTLSLPLSLMHLPLQYVDFSAWQRHTLTAELLQENLDYWKKQLNKCSRLHLPTTKKSIATEEYKLGKVSIDFSPSLTHKLFQISNSQQVTVFRVLLSGLALLLMRYCQQQDICIGTAVANRHHPDLQEVMGFFTNTVVLRLNMRADFTVKDLLHHTQSIVHEALLHQRAPFDRVINCVETKREIGRNPIFDVMTTMNIKTIEKHQVPCLEMTTMVENVGGDFPLLFEWLQQNNNIRVAIHYNTLLFSKTLIEEMATHYQLLMENMLSNIEQRICEVNMFTINELDYLIKKLNHSDKDFSCNKNIHQLFEDQAKKNAR